jgi:hypothetical protein
MWYLGFLVPMGSGGLVSSTDGINWTLLEYINNNTVSAVRTIFRFQGGVKTILWNGKSWLAGGYSGIPVTNNPNGVLYNSKDGNIWNTDTNISPYFVNGSIFSIGWNGNVYVATGITNTTVLSSVSFHIGYTNVVYGIPSTTGDSIIWNNALLPNNLISNQNVKLTKVYWNGNLWIIIGYISISTTKNNSIILYSTDGITWLQSTSGSLFSNSVTDIASNMLVNENFTSVPINMNKKTISILDNIKIKYADAYESYDLVSSYLDYNISKKYN